jgi:hypothetical protein
MPVLSFKERRGFSESHDALWEKAYQRYFPDMVGIMKCARGKYPGQGQGIDRVIQLASGATLRIEEKEREKDYGDILLEYEHSDGVAGWIEAPLTVDYLAYAFIPSGRVYLFPWELLRKAWRDNKNEWKRDYRTVKGNNGRYESYSIAVPVNLLLNAVCNAMRTG